jgi:excisionase family DNA binding protein
MQPSPVGHVWRVELKRIRRDFECLGAADVPRVTFYVQPNSDVLPPRMGTAGEVRSIGEYNDDGTLLTFAEIPDPPLEMVLSGIFPSGIFFEAKAVCAGFFGIPTDANRSKATRTWDLFRKLAYRAWNCLPKSRRDDGWTGAIEFKWMAVVCRTLLDAEQDAVFSDESLAGIKWTYGAAFASVAAIDILLSMTRSRSGGANQNPNATGQLVAQSGAPRKEPRRHFAIGGSPSSFATDEKQWLTVTEAATISGINRGTISRMASSGELKSNAKGGRHRRINSADLNRLILKRANRPERKESDESINRKQNR